MKYYETLSKVIVVAAGLSLSSCGTTTGNGVVTVSAGLAADPRAAVRLATDPTSPIEVCVQQAQFVVAGGAVLEVNLSKLASVTAAGVTLGSVTVPKTTYLSVRLVLGTDCGTGNSLDYTNAHGRRLTSDLPITLQFDGPFEVRPGAASSDLYLDFRSTAAALDDDANDSDAGVKGKVESQHGKGSCHDG